MSDLLTGVAWAMVASIFGIGLTTLNSLLFKKCKLQEESGKMNFWHGCNLCCCQSYHPILLMH